MPLIISVLVGAFITVLGHKVIPFISELLYVPRGLGHEIGQ